MINSFFVEEKLECEETLKAVSECNIGELIVDSDIKISIISKQNVKMNLLGIELENGYFLRGYPSIQVVTPSGPKKIVDLSAFELIKTKNGFVPLLKKVNITYYSGAREIADIESEKNYYMNDILIYGENI
jgi:hypothetical protein